MHKRVVAAVGILSLAIMTVMWVSADPQGKPSAKPTAVKSGSCCPAEGASKVTEAKAKGEIKPVATKSDKECPYMAGVQKKAVAAQAKKNCADCKCPEGNGQTASAKAGKSCNDCPCDKSAAKSMQAKAKPANVKQVSAKVKQTSTTKTANKL